MPISCHFRDCKAQLVTYSCKKRYNKYRDLYLYLWLFVIQTDKKRSVDETDGRLWSDAHGFLYFEVSALTGDGIADLFQVNK